MYFKVAPYSCLAARELISKISRWRELSISALKSRAESRSKNVDKHGVQIFNICLSIMLHGSPPVRNHLLSQWKTLPFPA